jgi:4-hydroxy-2-oxoheptanedioate aldolase
MLEATAQVCEKTNLKTSMKTNHVRAKLKHGDPSVGTWLTLSDPIAARMMARVGFDWLTVELEHSPTSFESAATSFAIISGSGVVPLARVPWNTGENIKRVLDTGAWGIVVPMVNSREEAEAAVSAARYAPKGTRTIGGQLHAINFETDPGTYYARANEEILVVLMAEHVKAIEKADEIFSVPGIDVVFIGPNDLHNSMGKKPAFESDDKEFTDAISHILKIASKYGIAPGIHVADEAAAQRRLAEGFQFIAVGSEAGMMLGKAQEIANTLGMGTKKGAVAKY